MKNERFARNNGAQPNTAENLSNETQVALILKEQSV